MFLYRCSANGEVTTIEHKFSVSAAQKNVIIHGCDLDKCKAECERLHLIGYCAPDGHCQCVNRNA